jgi:hypothetical protein
MQHGHLRTSSLRPRLHPRLSLAAGPRIPHIKFYYEENVQIAGERRIKP